MNIAFMQLVALIVSKAVQVFAHKDEFNYTAGVNRLLADLKPDLPVKPDGTDWTAADIHAICEANRSIGADIHAMLGPAPGNVD